MCYVCKYMVFFYCYKLFYDLFQLNSHYGVTASCRAIRSKSSFLWAFFFYP